MLFLSFNSQEERRNFGGSAFIEIQFCKMPLGTKIKKIVAVNNITNWHDDSLYVNDEDAFYDEYSHIFNCGVYGNLETGTVDIYGINYYSPALTDSIIKRILADKPKDYEVLIDWLHASKAYNGFYILGI